MNTSSLIQKVWNFCHTLRDDGVGYGDYLEQLTYLLFLKMAHEYAQEPYNRDTHIPSGYDWAALRNKTGEPLEVHYLATLHKLGNESGMLGAIFFKAQNKIQDPAKLSRLVQMIDAESWVGKAAVVLPDNVLFEGGAGEKIRRKLLETCDVHTLLRLPTGIFYANGVKANVLFFDAKPKDGQTHTQGTWIYDLRTNKHFTLKTKTLKLEDLRDFIACYHPENRHERQETERFKYFSYDEMIARDKASLDIFWLKDDSLDNLDDLPPPDVLQQEIIDHLEAALAAFRDVAVGLQR